MGWGHRRGRGLDLGGDRAHANVIEGNLTLMEQWVEGGRYSIYRARKKLPPGFWESPDT